MRMARNITSIGVIGSSLGLLASCGDPVPPAAQAGVSVHVQEYDTHDPEHMMDRCPPGRHWVNVPWEQGREPSIQRQQTSATEQGPIAVNNQDGNTVKCTVKAKGSGFDVTAAARGYAEDSKGMISPANVNIRIPSIVQGDTSAMGSMSIQDHASINTYESTQCLYSVSGNSLGIDLGKIWASVNCANLGFPQSPGSNCLVDTGYFFFENCAQ
jgi:hypothetical protein